jgi:polyhydroxyalkanoate synthesis regulator phasin
MADPADGAVPRGTLEQLLLAGVGGLALTAERVEALAAAIAERTSMAPADARALVDEQLTRWRGDVNRIAERAGRLTHELGLATREEVEELRLQVAQLDHRLRLLEKE